MHLVPGLDDNASNALVSEHIVAQKSISKVLTTYPTECVSVWPKVVADFSWVKAPQLLPVLRQKVACIDFDGKLLPVVVGLLSSISEDFDYVILSNSDIGVWPGIYEFVAAQLEEGVKAGSICRRTVIQFDYDSVPSPLGKTISHPGSDFFFFSTSCARQLCLKQTVLGAAGYGMLMRLNLAVLEPTFQTFREEFLTFHLGDERAWAQRSKSTALSRRHNSKNLLYSLFQLVLRFGFVRVLHSIENEFGSVRAFAKRIVRLLRR